ncbi:Alpha/Beta hydrolase protein [Cladorrhinum sp. PSN332]|nr:Alpha/Beta hydrolase protein [Cladorrhinum sp. PSN332]
MTADTKKPSWWPRSSFWIARNTNPKIPESSAFVSTKVSTSVGLSQHSAGTSRALAKASRDFKAFMEESGAKITKQHQRTLDRYLTVLEKHCLHKIGDQDEPVEFEASTETWGLINLAAQHSNGVYSDTAPATGVLINPDPVGDRKRSFIFLQELHHDQTGPLRVLVVAVRGSVTMSDWLVNGNGEGASSQIPGLSGGDADPRWHTGFLRVVKTMQDEVAQAIRQQLDSCTDQPELPLDVLFTGHSAGGAIAQIFYAMCTSTQSGSSAFAKVLPRIRRVNCIVFGAPPVATSPIISTGSKPGLFLSIINEGDPVPLLQQKYVDVLLQSFVLLPGSDEMRRLHPNGFAVPDLEFRVSGPCVVLRDDNDEDVNVTKWNAVSVRPELLERKLFAKVAAHHRAEYMERINYLVGQYMQCGIGQSR